MKKGRDERPELEHHSTWEFASALLLGRVILGLLFLMSGWFKVFEMGAVAHARQLFVEGYLDSWIPQWLLWATGTALPFVELISGGLLMLGARVRESLWSMGLILILVTYGHLLKDPLHDINTHIFPRLVLLVTLLLVPKHHDRWSVDAWIGGSQTKRQTKTQA